MSELKNCPFCGCGNLDTYKKEGSDAEYVLCKHILCEMFCTWTPIEQWQNRPIEEKLESQLEDLGNEFADIVAEKKAQALKIYSLTEMVRGDCKYCENLEKDKGIQLISDICLECSSRFGKQDNWQLKQEKDNG